MTQPAETARDRIAGFLAAHAESGKSEELAFCDHHDEAGYAVAVLWAYDLRAMLAELDTARAERERSAGRA